MTKPDPPCPVFWSQGHACSLVLGHEGMHYCPHGDSLAGRAAETGPWTRVPGQPTKASAPATIYGDLGTHVYTRNYELLREGQE